MRHFRRPGGCIRNKREGWRKFGGISIEGRCIRSDESRVQCDSKILNRMCDTLQQRCLGVRRQESSRKQRDGVVVVVVVVVVVGGEGVMLC